MIEKAKTDDWSLKRDKMNNLKIGSVGLDALVEKFETEDFIQNDPVQFAHRFSEPKNVEIAGFIASLLSYGKREVFIKKLDELFNLMNNNPLEFALNFNHKSNCLKGFNYRFAKDTDIMQIILILGNLYKKSSLQELFAHNWHGDVKSMLQGVVDYFYAAETQIEFTQGFCHLLPNPRKNSALKRLNMFLRWMIRSGPVDLALWDFMDKSELLIPLDVHVARVSRASGLLLRSSNDFHAVIELTNNLKKFDPKDPVKYDFAMFGAGVNTLKN